MEGPWWWRWWWWWWWPWPKRDALRLPLVPGSVAAAPALPPGGKIGRTLSAVVATLDELRAYGSIVDGVLFDDARDPESALVAGLVSGTAGSETMHRYADVPGVALSGDSILEAEEATFTVSGAAAAHGKLHWTRTGVHECTLSGSLGGRNVTARC